MKSGNIPSFSRVTTLIPSAQSFLLGRQLHFPLGVQEIMRYVLVRQECDHCGRHHSHQVRLETFVETAPAFMPAKQREFAVLEMNILGNLQNKRLHLPILK